MRKIVVLAAATLLFGAACGHHPTRAEVSETDEGSVSVTSIPEIPSEGEIRGERIRRTWIAKVYNPIISVEDVSGSSVSLQLWNETSALYAKTIEDINKCGVDAFSAESDSSGCAVAAAKPACEELSDSAMKLNREQYTNRDNPDFEKTKPEAVAALRRTQYEICRRVCPQWSHWDKDDKSFCSVSARAFDSLLFYIDPNSLTNKYPTFIYVVHRDEAAHAVCENAALNELVDERIKNAPIGSQTNYLAVADVITARFFGAATFSEKLTACNGTITASLITKPLDEYSRVFPATWAAIFCVHENNGETRIYNSGDTAPSEIANSVYDCKQSIAGADDEITMRQYPSEKQS